MTGPEHYHEAERLLRNAIEDPDGDEALALAHAQVHAQLALAAATALQPSRWPVANRVYTDWTDVVLPVQEWRCMDCGAIKFAAPGVPLPDPQQCSDCTAGVPFGAGWD
ncbi:MAG: hypothetical protein GEV11_18860 [Streptosporangiales bacterium]|nr:hypothetical protein [Streptosporangiales bacterium]